jgi:hypothetical protein
MINPILPIAMILLQRMLTVLQGQGASGART